MGRKTTHTPRRPAEASALTDPSFEERFNHALRTVLRASRHDAGLTQRDLALKLKRPQSFVARVEFGERRVTVSDLMQFAAALEVLPSTLIERVEHWLSSSKREP